MKSAVLTAEYKVMICLNCIPSVKCHCMHFVYFAVLTLRLAQPLHLSSEVNTDSVSPDLLMHFSLSW